MGWLRLVDSNHDRTSLKDSWILGLALLDRLFFLSGLFDRPELHTRKLPCISSFFRVPPEVRRTRPASQFQVRLEEFGSCSKWRGPFFLHAGPCPFPPQGLGARPRSTRETTGRDPSALLPCFPTPATLTRNSGSTRCLFFLIGSAFP